MRLSHGAALVLLPLVSGCYGSVGPTVGLDLKTGRAALGVEASGQTVTIAHSVALGAPAPGRKDWSTHTSLLWEPGFGGVLDGHTNGNFVFLGAGASAGARLNRYDNAPPDVDFVLGAWTSAGSALNAKANYDCGASDTRPFAAFVVGVRGWELYASPKIGVMSLPNMCLNIFGEGTH